MFRAPTSSTAPSSSLSTATSSREPSPAMEATLTPRLLPAAPAPAPAPRPPRPHPPLPARARPSPTVSTRQLQVCPSSEVCCRCCCRALGRRRFSFYNLRPNLPRSPSVFFATATTPRPSSRLLSVFFFPFDRIIDCSWAAVHTCFALISQH